MFRAGGSSFISRIVMHTAARRSEPGAARRASRKVAKSRRRLTGGSRTLPESGTFTLLDLRSASKTGDVVAVVNGLSGGHGHWFARLRPPVEHVASPSKKLDTVER